MVRKNVRTPVNRKKARKLKKISINYEFSRLLSDRNLMHETFIRKRNVFKKEFDDLEIDFIIQSQGF